MLSSTYVWRDEGSTSLPKPGGVILSCFPSAGLAAIVAAHYMVRALKLQRVGFFTGAENLPIAVIQNGKVNPPIRVYGRNDLAVVVSEFPTPATAIYPLAEAILDGAERKKARLLLGLEGVIPHPVVEEEEGPPEKAPRKGEEEPEERVWAASSRGGPEVQSWLEHAGARTLEDGVIGGVSGALLVAGIQRTIPVSLLLASAREAEGYPDHRAAISLIETVDRLLPEVEIDTGPLRTQAEMIERVIRAAMVSRSKAVERAKAQELTPTIYQ